MRARDVVVYVVGADNMRMYAEEHVQGIGTVGRNGSVGCSSPVEKEVESAIRVVAKFEAVELDKGR